MLFRCHRFKINMLLRQNIVQCSMEIFRNFLSDNPVSHEIKRAAAVVKTLYQNGLHTVLPVFYKASSILATIPATSCSAERSFSGLRRVKTYLRSTMVQVAFLFFAWNEHILIEFLKMTNLHPRAFS